MFEFFWIMDHGSWMMMYWLHALQKTATDCDFCLAIIIIGIPMQNWFEYCNMSPRKLRRLYHRIQAVLWHL